MSYKAGSLPKAFNAMCEGLLELVNTMLKQVEVHENTNPADHDDDPVTRREVTETETEKGPEEAQRSAIDENSPIDASERLATFKKLCEEMAAPVGEAAASFVMNTLIPGARGVINRKWLRLQIVRESIYARIRNKFAREHRRNKFSSSFKAKAKEASREIVQAGYDTGALDAPVGQWAQLASEDAFNNRVGNLLALPPGEIFEVEPVVREENSGDEREGGSPDDTISLIRRTVAERLLGSDDAGVVSVAYATELAQRGSIAGSTLEEIPEKVVVESEADLQRKAEEVTRLAGFEAGFDSLTDDQQRQVMVVAINLTLGAASIEESKTTIEAAIASGELPNPLNG